MTLLYVLNLDDYSVLLQVGTNKKHVCCSYYLKQVFEFRIFSWDTVCVPCYCFMERTVAIMQFTDLLSISKLDII